MMMLALHEYEGLVFPRTSMAGGGGGRLMLEAQSPQDQQGYLRGLTLLFPASLPLLQQFS